MTWRIHHGHALEQLAAMPDASVQMCATSPPYWGLRDYGDKGQPWPSVSYSPMPGLPPLTIPASTEPLGLEADPWAYVGHLVAIFREVRRVLRDDGVLFLNLGDSYAGTSQTGGLDVSGLLGYGNSGTRSPVDTHAPKRQTPPALKPKDLVGIPWRAAYALQADGWYLRSDVIWAKPNPMPESVRDRPTKAHEYVFLLSKGPMYFWDQEAVREGGPWKPGGYAGNPARAIAMGRKPSGNEAPGAKPEGSEAGRNLRTVWTIATQPYPGAHFAVWPSALAERCIRAGSSPHGACSECGAPWVRQCERVSTGKRYSVGKSLEKNKAGLATGFSGYDDGSSCPEFRTTGWAPSCTHDAARRPCVVLDPFSGAGTTGLVAARLGRDYIGIEQSAEYARLSRQRIVSELGADRETLERLGEDIASGAQVGLFG